MFDVCSTTVFYTQLDRVSAVGPYTANNRTCFSTFGGNI